MRVRRKAEMAAQTCPKGYKDALTLDHMSYSTTDMSYPTHNGLEITVKQMNTAMDICHKNTDRRTDYGRNFGSRLD